MSRTGRRSDEPRAVIHRRILDVADDKPDASLEEIADEVSGASAELVDKVLAEYGDPSEEPSEPDGGDDTDADQPESINAEDADAGSTESVDTEDTDADPLSETEDEDGVRRDTAELSETQLETLGLIARNPDATQRELAAELDVTAATISRWVNDIPGFDWGDRETFARSVLDDDLGEDGGSDEDSDDATGSDEDSDETTGSSVSASGDAPIPIAVGSDVATGEIVENMNGNTENGQTGGDTGSEDDNNEAFAELRQRVVAIEDRLGEDSGDTTTGESSDEREDTGFDRIGTELLHKVVDACMSSERMTEEEEIRILDRLRD